MGKAEVLSLLRDGEYVSGEEISRALGVTRAAVWKAVQALRADGCSIDSVPNRGYCLHRPESALSDAAVHALLEGCPWPINVLPTVDSTNTYAKAQAALGAPHGSVYVTGRQTGGRGRRGRRLRGLCLRAWRSACVLEVILVVHWCLPWVGS